MRRLLLVALVVVMGLAAIGAIVVFLLLRPGSEVTPAADQETVPVGGLTPAQESDQSAAELAAADSDNDGLINSEEVAWKSNLELADTDGDGFLDGEEVQAGHDPTKPGPNDTLTGSAPTAAAPAAATGAAAAGPLNPDQYLADDLDFSGEGENLTAEFEQQYSEELRSPSAMSEFATTRPVIELLPRPSAAELPLNTISDTTATLTHYIAVADNGRVLADADLYGQAQLNLQRGNPATMQSLATLVRLYRDELLQISVPTSAVPMQTLLLAYTEAAAATFDQISVYDTDPVRSMAATHQLEVIDRKYYPLIRAEFNRLQALRDSLANAVG